MSKHLGAAKSIRPEHPEEPTPSPSSVEDWAFAAEHPDGQRPAHEHGRRTDEVGEEARSDGVGRAGDGDAAGVEDEVDAECEQQQAQHQLAAVAPGAWRFTGLVGARPYADGGRFSGAHTRPICVRISITRCCSLARNAP